VQEPEGFALFVREHSRRLLRSAWLLTGDWPAAEDLVQASLTKTWRRWESIEVAAPAREAYVRRVMTTTFLAGRRRRWHGEIATAAVPEPRGELGGLDRVDERLALLAALATLPPRQRAVVVLRYFNDLTESQTASAMGCSLSTVKTHSTRALQVLRTVPGLAAYDTHKIGGQGER
jgi:RNA polymerase sigma-70 factor (sigma-E family)